MKKAIALTFTSLLVFGIYKYSSKSKGCHSGIAQIHLPKPTGNFRPGTSIYHLIDKNRKELFSDNSDDFRELLIQIWYPTDSKNYNAQERCYTSPQLAEYIKVKAAQQENVDRKSILSLEDLVTNSL